MKTFVDIHDVTHVYARAEDGIPAVECLDLKIREGEFAAIVGPSGCGKSTLMKLATGLQFPKKGTVIVDGKQVGSPVKLAGMAFQNPTMLPWRTTLAQVGLKGQGHKFPWQLSGGMQQRASLCRALIHEPKLLMLDEPFGALDSFTREELWCVIRDLHAAQGVTVILVTHDLREAAFLADRIFCMSARPGRIIAERTVEFPRPRDLEITYAPEFTVLVHELRGRIAQARMAA